MNKKYLMPEHIEFLYWLLYELDSKYPNDHLGYIRKSLRDIIKQGWYRNEDAEVLNKIVDLYKQKWLWRKTGPVQHKR